MEVYNVVTLYFYYSVFVKIHCVLVGFCITIYIYRYKEWNVLMHIKIIFVMDARVNVNIDVFVLNFHWTDLQGVEKNPLKLIIISSFLNIR